MLSFEWPSHTLIWSSGTRALRKVSVLNLRKACSPIFFPVKCNARSTFRCLFDLAALLVLLVRLLPLRLRGVQPRRFGPGLAACAVADVVLVCTMY